MTKQPAVYMLANKRNGTIYVGVTSDLVQRVWQHRNDIVQGFTAKYKVHILVYYELFEDMLTAIGREKQLKKVASCVEDGSHRKNEPWMG